jgi:hypothetical protein
MTSCSVDILMIILAQVLLFLLVVRVVRMWRARGSDIGTDGGTYSIRGQKFILPRALPPTLDLTKMQDRHEELLQLLAAWSHACKETGVNWWLGYGACLGWVRNKSLVPWDDDIDVHVQADHVPSIQTRVIPFLRKHRPDLIMLHCFGFSLKLLQRETCKTFIDVFAKEFAGGVWKTRDIARGMDNFLRPLDKFVYKDNLPEDMLFPLQRQQLHGVEVFLPADPLSVSRLTYGAKCVEEIQVFPLHDQGVMCERADCLEL